MNDRTNRLVIPHWRYSGLRLVIIARTRSAARSRRHRRRHRRLGAFLQADLVLSHYDAKAHLVVARRVFDNLTPGLEADRRRLAAAAPPAHAAADADRLLLPDRRVRFAALDRLLRRHRLGRRPARPGRRPARAPGRRRRSRCWSLQPEPALPAGDADDRAAAARDDVRRGAVAVRVGDARATDTGAGAAGGRAGGRGVDAATKPGR